MTDERDDTALEGASDVPETGEHPRLPLARRVARQLSVEAGAGACFLAGSLTAGLGNRTSDIDVYLVHSGDGSRPRTRSQLVLDRTRFDVQQLTATELAGVVDRVSGASHPSEGGSVLPQQDVDLVVRLRYGEVITDDGTLAPLADRARAASEPVRRALITHWLTTAHYELEDLAGLLPDDPDAAVMSARTGLLLAGKAVAASCDDLYRGQKWTWRQLLRSAPDGFPLEHFRALLRRDPLAAESGMTALADFTQTCLAASATLGWFGVPLAHWPSWRTGSGPLRRAPGFSPRAYDDALVLALPARRRVRLRPAAALVWALCDGVSAETLRTRVRALRESHPQYASLDSDRCDRLLGQLVTSHLVESA